MRPAGVQLSASAPCWVTVTVVNAAQADAGATPNAPVGAWLSRSTIAGTSTTLMLCAASSRVTVGTNRAATTGYVCVIVVPAGHATGEPTPQLTVRVTPETGRLSVRESSVIVASPVLLSQVDE